MKELVQCIDIVLTKKAKDYCKGCKHFSPHLPDRLFSYSRRNCQNEARWCGVVERIVHCEKLNKPNKGG